MYIDKEKEQFLQEKRQLCIDVLEIQLTIFFALRPSHPSLMIYHLHQLKQLPDNRYWLKITTAITWISLRLMGQNIGCKILSLAPVLKQVLE